jgi:hypothetical protein
MVLDGRVYSSVPHMAKKRCPKCKYLNAPEVDVCSLCSEVLPLRPGAADMLEEPRELKDGKSKARHQKISDDRRHYFVPASGPPVQLDMNVRFVLGRDPRASLPIQPPDVSRRHAEVVWAGDPPQPSLRDIASRHGTFLNGKRLAKDEEVELRHGDFIQLAGSFTCSYRFAAPPDLDKQLLAEKRAEETLAPSLPAELGGRVPPTSATPLAPAPVAAAPAVAATVPAGALAGRFDTLPARSLLLLLEVLGATGRLVVRCGDANGLLDLHRGQPVHVEYAGISGTTAIVALSGLQRGQFEFHPAGEGA